VTTRSPGGYHSVQRFVRQLLQTQPVPFVRMEAEPGQESPGDLARALGDVDGKRRRPNHLFRIVLSHSPKATVKWSRKRPEIHPVSGKCVSFTRRVPAPDHRQPASGP